MGCSRYVWYISIYFQHLCACSIFFHYTSLRFSQAFPTCFDDGSVSKDTAQPTTPSPSIVSSSLFAHRARARRGVRRSTPDSGIQRDARDGLIDWFFVVGKPYPNDDTPGIETTPRYRNNTLTNGAKNTVNQPWYSITTVLGKFAICAMVTKKVPWSKHAVCCTIIHPTMGILESLLMDLQFGFMTIPT